MEADFSGYATKYGVKCTDGRTILPDAFAHQDKITVPLVWHHGHTDPENVLGKVVLESRSDGVFAHAYFNGTSKASHAYELVKHGDIDSLSIWANQLVEKAGRVVHGLIREVSLVMAGANPAAKIENVTLRHGDGDVSVLPDEAIIYAGAGLEWEILSHEEAEDTQEEPETPEDLEPELDSELQHAVGGETIQDVYDSMSDTQKNVLHYMIGEALAAAGDNTDTAAHGEDMEGTNTMAKNVFESQETPESKGSVLSHDDMQSILADARRSGSLHGALQNFIDDAKLSHGIEDINLLFPDARTITDTPEWNKRRTEWVSRVFTGISKVPFSRIKTIVADITADEARAKGYVKGTLKKEEWFGLTKRTTSPTTIYKKQQLDRDDMIDITDFNVVTWLWGEMRLMLDEEIARAILVGDGRDIASEDKVKDPAGASSGDGIRSILNDHELFVTTITANVDDAASSYDEVIDVVLDGMEFYKGTGTPEMFCSLKTLNMFLKAKDGMQRRLYANKAEVAVALGVSDIVVVEIMNDYPSVVGIIVNLADYKVGTDKGGEVSQFDDFDIDYNKYKYLIEGRMSGALNKIKSALVVMKTAAANVLVKAAKPGFNPATGALTIVNQTGVVYKNEAGTVINAAGSPYTVAPGASYIVNATPATGYYFADNATDSWTFTANPA